MSDNGSQRDLSYRAELRRKAIHLLGLLIPLGYFVVPYAWAVGILGGIFAVTMTVDILRLVRAPAYGIVRPLIGSLIRPKEQNSVTGATYVVLAGLCCRIAFSVPVAAAAMGFIVLGDTAAALVGRRWGRFKIWDKSLEGSLAFFGIAAVWGAFLPGVPAGWGIAAAGIATITELTSGYVNDNISVPLISGAFLHFAPHWF